MKRVTQKVFGVAGWKNSGKTTLTEKLVTELTRRGWTVSTVKHAHHAFDIDHPGTDSFRHREAGAREVAVVSSNRWALVHELRGEEEPTLSQILARIGPCDLVLVEGYKTGPHKKLEVRRLEARKREPIDALDGSVVAIAADHDVPNAFVPVFDLNDIGGIADLIESETGLKA